MFFLKRNFPLRVEILRAGQVRKLVRKSANPQLRTNKKSCGHADLRTLAVEIADLRLRTILNFSPQFRKFYTNIEIPFYFCKIFMFLPSQTLDINLIFRAQVRQKYQVFRVQADKSQNY